MTYPDAAWERAMTVQEVILKALSGEIHWFRAADILGVSPRTSRRWRERYAAQTRSSRSRCPAGMTSPACRSNPFHRSWKRDIFYKNAARFLRLGEEEFARHHGR
jgi:hypothetical protein